MNNDPTQKHWPHAPPHKTLLKGTYMVTAGTFHKEHFFKSPERLERLQNSLIYFSKLYNWNIQSWAIFSNHYHFIGQSNEKSGSLSSFLSNLHCSTANYVNIRDKSPGRRIWYQYYDTQLTYSYSYLARLNYVNQNPVKHGFVKSALDYPWCSASWFKSFTPRSFYNTIMQFKINNLQIEDDF